jgi:hypothetical protein
VIARYPGGVNSWVVADGSRQSIDREDGKIWFLEPDGRVRCFDSLHEYTVRPERADQAREEFFSWVSLSAESVEVVPVSPVQAAPAAAPVVAPYEILPRPKYFRKHNLRILFYGRFERAIPSGSRFWVTPRGVIVVTPLSRVMLYGPAGRVRLTASEEASLGASVPLSTRRR